ncbi:MAG: hypothetical protein M1418_06125 [Deltaproteobacteria bacterium]|nr:hypothetical protein [Deltaproteobacteria bacterium]
MYEYSGIWTARREYPTVLAPISKIETDKAEPGIYRLLMVKKLADTDDYLRENLTRSWLLEGKGKGVF